MVAEAAGRSAELVVVGAARVARAAVTPSSAPPSTTFLRASPSRVLVTRREGGGVMPQAGLWLTIVLSALRAVLGLVLIEIVEVEVGQSAEAAGKRVEQLRLPETARLLSVMRDGKAEIAVGSTELRGGDQVLAILQPGGEDELRKLLVGEKRKKS